MEYRNVWNIGIIYRARAIEKDNDSWNKHSMVTDRKNINRGFKKLRVWQDAVSLYVLACNIFADFPFELKKVAASSIDTVFNPLFHFSNIPAFHVKLMLVKTT